MKILEINPGKGITRGKFTLLDKVENLVLSFEGCNGWLQIYMWSPNGTIKGQLTTVEESGKYTLGLDFDSTSPAFSP